MVRLLALVFAALSCCGEARGVALTRDPDMFLFWRHSGGRDRCKPFTLRVIVCNPCVCAADGTEYCTRMTCDGSAGESPWSPTRSRRRSNRNTEGGSDSFY